LYPEILNLSGFSLTRNYRRRGSIVDINSKKNLPIVEA
jgi:hypothetical protein